ncbi:sigma-70 family RNA polymerase sigma factor [Lysinibacillus pakistanensis]|uniref:Sigma-70 family RNA polymerase sigma factor n=1 Tax=Lysinibacillus pakistanensis TaxID=759811 RepID=A0AAX3X0V0_9BACI|nr:sigma-70 family RNA polymerase sigma factor [Lysinibacillus pakistanensis]MDM5233291.1 sigma-70 family RNA polymerase sigma factor [Lysinibacillus pakistanensis]WHY48769.1 sigma-70 family RNA polymerase sigma factor [Lysinibacillus pakistanensis]WHY53781.1 sigma-70 family RNA polymerase sigma factor [Lysinibacillus pakistanensis]
MEHDISIVQQAIAGDKEAFEQLLILEEEKLFYTALSYVGQKEDALDAIQEAACKAYLSVSQLKQPEFFSTWLFRILIHECYRLLKKGQKMIPYEESELLNRLQHKENVVVNPIDLSEAIKQLNHSQQMAIILFYYYDLPMKDISEVMEKPVSTIKTYLHRGKKQLKRELERSVTFNEKVI